MSTAMRRRRLLRRSMAALAWVVALTMLLATAVLAASPQRLATQLTDDVGALGGGRAQVQSAFDKLQRDTGVQLWIWITDTTGNLSPPDFAGQTASRSGLGGGDLLFVIAMSDGAYGYWKSDSLPLSNARLDQLTGSSLEPGLRSDTAGALARFAAALDSELAPPAPTPGPSTSGGGSTSSGGDSGLGTTLAVLMVVVLIAGIGWWFFYVRPHQAGRPAATATPGDPNADLASLSPKQLDELANRLLVEADDAVRDSDQELGFAQAQFGDEEAAPFVAAIAAAKDDMKAAFTLRQQLDDATPEDAPTRRRMLTDLVVACRRAEGRLAAEEERFAKLREMEKHAPDILAGLPARADALDARLPAARETMTHLADYAPTDSASVAANVDEASKRIAAVRAAAAEGTKAVAAGDLATAARAARLGEDGVAQATAFLDGIDKLAHDLDAARDKVGAELAEAKADIARARAALQAAAAAPGASPAALAAPADAAAQLDRADQLLAEATTALNPPLPDVAGAYAKASEADQIADSVATAIRSAQQAAVMATARLDASIRAAQAAVTQASGYLDGRRGGVGSEARTRLSEAQRHLDQAVAMGATDSAAAQTEADQATRLAGEAYSLAQRDYDRWDDPWRGGGGRGGGGGAGSDIAGAVIGGIIGGMLSGGFGGGRRGGGGFGGGFGGFGGGWGGGSIGGGSFGGGGSTGGGRF